MQNASKVLTALVAVAALALIGVGIGRWAGGRAKPAPQVQPLSSTETSNRTALAPGRSGPRLSASNTSAHPHEIRMANVDPLVPTPTDNTPSTNAWENKLDQILSSDSDDTNKVKELFALFPSLPDDGKDEVAQHLSNLVEDDDYAPLGRLLADPTLPEDALDTLMADLLNRPNATKLPTLLDLARNADHPKHEEARDLLELYLDPAEDYGTDWAKWEKGVKDWLADPENKD